MSIFRKTNKVSKSEKAPPPKKSKLEQAKAEIQKAGDTWVQEAFYVDGNYSPARLKRYVASYLQNKLEALMLEASGMEVSPWPPHELRLTSGPLRDELMIAAKHSAQLWVKNYFKVAEKNIVLPPSIIKEVERRYEEAYTDELLNAAAARGYEHAKKEIGRLLDKLVPISSEKPDNSKDD